MNQLKTINGKEEGNCTSACQYATKIACMCGCGGKNHGIKSIVKMDSFFAKEREKKEREEEDKEYDRNLKASADYFYREFVRGYNAKMGALTS